MKAPATAVINDAFRRNNAIVSFQSALYENVIRRLLGWIGHSQRRRRDASRA
jgi:hypothetical protein